MSNNITFDQFSACMESVNQKIRDNIDSINAGGCAFFASELAYRMRDAGITDFAVVVFGGVCEEESKLIPLYEAIDDMRSYDVDLDCIFNWNAFGINFAHVVIEWRGIKWDAVEPFKGTEWQGALEYEGGFPEDSLHAIGQCSDGWNRTYDRSQDDTVREILDCAFAMLHQS